MSTGSYYRHRLLLSAAVLLGLLITQALPFSPLHPIASVSAASAAYVSPSGSDSNPGTEAQPFKTIQKAVDTAGAGSTIYIRAGTYREVVRVSRSGAAGQPLTIAGYPGERPLIDGANSLPSGSDPSWSPMVYITGSYVTLSNLEIANSLGIGLQVTGNNNIIRNVNVHHSRENGVLITSSGANNLVENSDVWSNCMSNANGSGGRWASGLSAARNPTHTTLRGNRVYNNWGEGLSTFEASNTTIEDNTVYDNYAVNIYIDNAPYTTVQRNLVYHTGNAAFAKAPGIAFCDEDYGHPAASHDVKIINNLVLGGNRGFYFWLQRADGGLKNFTIAYNTFVNSNNAALFQIGAGNHQNSRIENNVFLQEDSLPIAVIAGSAGLSFSNNLWSKTPPPEAQGTASIVANPQLAKAGSTSPGQLSPNWFMQSAGSPAIGRAVAIAEVSTDYAGNARGSSPDCGAWEYQGQVVSPTAAPTDPPAPTATLVKPSSTPVPPTATATARPSTATPVPPKATATARPSTATPAPPTATATARPSTATPVPPKATATARLIKPSPTPVTPRATAKPRETSGPAGNKPWPYEFRLFMPLGKR